jgi:hypothetical protein
VVGLRSIFRFGNTVSLRKSYSSSIGKSSSTQRFLTCCCGNFSEISRNFLTSTSVPSISKE